MAVLMKHVATYQKTKPVYEAYRKAKDKDAYRAKQESSLILHEAAVKTLKAAGVTKLPNLAAMQEEYGKLQVQKEALYANYGKLKKQVKEYDIIKQNIDSILRLEGCISAPLVPKGFIRRSCFRLVFSKIPVPAHSLMQAGEARRLPRRSCSLLPAQCFQRLRPGR